MYVCMYITRALNVRHVRRPRVPYGRARRHGYGVRKRVLRAPPVFLVFYYFIYLFFFLLCPCLVQSGRTIPM